MKEQVFYNSWQFIGDESLVPLSKHVHPFILMDGFLTEPMLLSMDENEKIHCLSNVCTHRGNLVADSSSSQRNLICKYHGRKFDLTGSFVSMPEFEEAENFPRPCEDLHAFDLEKWGPLLFAKLGGNTDFGKVIEEMNQYVGFLPIEDLVSALLSPRIIW